MRECGQAAGRRAGIQTADLSKIALAAALTAVGAYLQIPTAIPFTMQTFAVLTAAGLLGPARAVAAVGSYLLLGLCGVPVFAGFRSGAGVLLSATGGYLVGFVFLALVSGCSWRRLGRSVPAMLFSMAAGLFFCYLFGTLWYCYLYASGTGFLAAAAACVLPYLPAEAVKVALAILVIRRVEPHLKQS